jgi:hypothetical protein
MSRRAKLRKVLEKTPTSINALAKASRVPHSTLVRVRDGDLNLSSEATEKVVRTLREWGNLYLRLADELEQEVR